MALSTDSTQDGLSCGRAFGQGGLFTKGWSVKQRKSYMRKHRKLLLQGHVDQVISAVEAICRGRNSKAIRTQRDYFINNSARMAYKRLRAIKMQVAVWRARFGVQLIYASKVLAYLGVRKM